MNKNKKKLIIDYIKKNQMATVREINKKFKCCFYKHFEGGLKEACSFVNIPFMDEHAKRRLKKQKEVISYIRNNPKAAQWGINKACNTHVQELFEEGIREAYQKARIRYPKERRIVYGAAEASTKARARAFERYVFNQLRQFDVRREVIISKGRVDALLNYRNLLIVIEVKDYRSKPVSSSEYKQLKKYVLAAEADGGILVINGGLSKKLKFVEKEDSQILCLNINQLPKIEYHILKKWGHGLTRHDDGLQSSAMEN